MPKRGRAADFAASKRFHVQRSQKAEKLHPKGSTHVWRAEMVHYQLVGNAIVHIIHSVKCIAYCTSATDNCNSDHGSANILD